MIKVSVMYPNTPGARFGPCLLPRPAHAAGAGAHGGQLQALHGGQRDRGRRAGRARPYIGMCHIFSDSVETFQAGFGPHAKEIMADIANYIDLTPVMQISEVVVG